MGTRTHDGHRESDLVEGVALVADRQRVAHRQGALLGRRSSGAKSVAALCRWIARVSLMQGNGLGGEKRRHGRAPSASGRGCACMRAVQLGADTT